ncbi:Ig-like domain-containing protein [Chitinophaga nivalis]|uniref:Ig-like domain-containing protein n=1 Tax=Chitinophaga nivalis TaxID=2991709 RepID=A0ABT3IME9_9BACT|nr:hypothetical protein [Chitinophaga nivalis]MCW3465162.1 hypothetical protein [Chitinophaga nivalis]MCW3485146.1 hypothetical protein [Chitinophaga nivalis]
MMLPKFYSFSKMLILFLLFSCLLLPKVRAQVYANSQTAGVTGLCLLCGVANAGNAVNNSNLNDYATFNIGVGLLGVSVYQTLIFPAVGTAGCDSLVIGIGSGNAVLSVNLLAALTIQTFNGTVANNDAQRVDSNNLRLWGNNRAEIVLKPASTFDRVSVTLSSPLLGLLNGFNLYYAYRKPALAAPKLADSTSICRGDTATLTATVPAGVTVRWYDVPAGGTLRYTGARYKVSPAVTTSYYAEAAKSGCTSDRKKIAVIVHPKPANPVFTVNPSVYCNAPRIGISNHTAAVYYQVRTVYDGLDGQLLDTAFTVMNSDTVVVRDLNEFYNVTTRLYIQAVDKLTGCRSDTVMQTLIFSAHATYADVDADNVTICKGDSITLRAYAHGQPNNTLVNIRWYDAPTGGTQLHRGKEFRVSPADTTRYYVTTGYYCEYLVRTKVTVNVRKLPAPVFTVPQGPTCGATKIKIENHQAGYSYRVRFRFRYNPEILFDTAYVVHTSTFPIYGFLPPLPSVVDIYVQAVDAVTGCRSDTAHKLMNIDGYGQLPAVDADSLSICKGDSATLHAFVPIYMGARIRWYDAPVGGNQLYRGYYFKVSPPQTTVYYAAGGYGCEFPKRVPVKVIVKQCTKQAYHQASKSITFTHTLTLFPNPSAGEVRLQEKTILAGSWLIIRNAGGMEVQRNILADNRFMFAPQLSNGIYFIEIRKSAGEVYVGRVMLTR